MEWKEWKTPEQIVRRYGESTRAYVIRRDGRVCVYCTAPVHDDLDWDDYAPDRLTIDHAVPTSRGGTNLAVNLVVACLACNNAKGQMTPDEFLAWSLRWARRILARHERAEDQDRADGDRGTGLGRGTDRSA